MDINEWREVTATHFDILGMKRRYRYYWDSKIEEGIATYPMVEVENVVNRFKLNNFPVCCVWREQTSDNVTQVFFLCQDKDEAKKVREDLLKGAKTKDVLPKIQNNYKSGIEKFPGDKLKYNNIALCGDWPKGGWVVDRVRHKAFGEYGSTNGVGLVHHVTNEPADDPEDVYLNWTQINSTAMAACHYHGELTFKVCFVSSTLYEDDLPTRSTYPSNGEMGEYYHRIKIPLSEVAQRLRHMFYWCSAISPMGVGEVHYICGGDQHIDDIQKMLAECISIVSTRAALENSVFSDYNIVAVPQ